MDAETKRSGPSARQSGLGKIDATKYLINQDSTIYCTLHLPLVGTNALSCSVSAYQPPHPFLGFSHLPARPAKVRGVGIETPTSAIATGFVLLIYHV